MATAIKETKIKLTFGFADSETRTVELGPYDSNDDAVLDAKNNIKAFNVTPIQSLYLSDAGASSTGIIAASIVTVSEKELDISDLG